MATTELRALLDAADKVAEWRPVPGEPGYYASSEGEVWSLRGRKPKKLGFAHPMWPYLRVSIKRGRGLRQTTAHQLVAEAFHGPCPAGLQVRHLDGDSRNNRPENLRYGTAKENGEDRIRHGTSGVGEQASGSKVSELDVIWIRLYAELRYRHTDIAAAFGLARTGVTSIVRRSSWRHI